jgi:hypothetical protein
LITLLQITLAHFLCYLISTGFLSVDIITHCYVAGSKRRLVEFTYSYTTDTVYLTAILCTHNKGILLFKLDSCPLALLRLVIPIYLCVYQILRFIAGFREVSPDTPAFGQVPKPCDATLLKQRLPTLRAWRLRGIPSAYVPCATYYLMLSSTSIS